MVPVGVRLVRQKSLRSTLGSGSSVARQRTWLGAKGSRVQIPPPRPTSIPPALPYSWRPLVTAVARSGDSLGAVLESAVPSGFDGLPDLMLDSVARGRVELRVRWDGGAKGRKSRRVPITPKLAAAIKRYEARNDSTSRIRSC